MPTTSSQRVTATPDTGPRRAGSQSYFNRLLAQRRLFGQLAECQRSHRGQNTTTDMLDQIVNLLTDELEIRFPDDWADHEPDLLMAEVALLHDPEDGYQIGCGTCLEHQQAAREDKRRRRRNKAAGAHHNATAPAVA